jgi:hypothetical protein
MAKEGAQNPLPEKKSTLDGLLGCYLIRNNKIMAIIIIIIIIIIICGCYSIR